MLRFGDNNEIITEETCRAILAGVRDEKNPELMTEELEALAEAAGVVVVGTAIQSMTKTNPATLIGSGKVEELAMLCENMDVDTVIFNRELSGMQMRNLEDRLGVRVIDRTILILDIFAGRATSAEGKLQVELAQLSYRLPRLMGFGKSLSRLGGGIGTRGPGEKQLETDRRHINRRMDDIKKELATVMKNRDVRRSKREKAQVPVVALAGYTNAGKSALMNRLIDEGGGDRSEKGVFQEDMLFATLDTAQRRISFDGKNYFVLIDTVGFVSNLPHALIDAFKATLEEVKYADLILNVVDVSAEENEYQIETTEKVLGEIGAGDKERLMVYNKVDIAEREPLPVVPSESVFISATRGDGIDELKRVISEKLFAERITARLFIPFERGDIFSFVQNRGEVKETEYTNEGYKTVVTLSERDYGRVKEYDTL